MAHIRVPTVSSTGSQAMSRDRYTSPTPTLNICSSKTSFFSLAGRSRISLYPQFSSPQEIRLLQNGSLLFWTVARIVSFLIDWSLIFSSFSFFWFFFGDTLLTPTGPPLTTYLEFLARSQQQQLLDLLVDSIQCASLPQYQGLLFPPTACIIKPATKAGSITHLMETAPFSDRQFAGCCCCLSSRIFTNQSWEEKFKRFPFLI